MPDISKLNAIAIADVAEVDGLAKASILDIDGVSVPSGGLKSAYSVRLLNTTLGLSYSGPCMRVRRSSDNQEQDINFSSGVVDTTAIATFVGAGNDGFVHTWYDQSSNALDITSAASTQGQICTSGTVNVDGDGDPYIKMSTSEYITGYTIQNPYAILATYYGPTDKRIAGGTSVELNIQSAKVRLLDSATTVITGATSVATYTKHCVAGTADGTSGTVRLDGSQDGSGTLSGIDWPTDTRVFQRINFTNWGPFQAYEWIAWEEVPSNLATIEQDVISHFNI